jgi:hypothetical protein
VQYELAMYEHFSGFQKRTEVTAAPMQTHPENMSEEDRDIELLTSRCTNDKDCMEEHESFNFDFGLNFEWDKEPAIIDVSVRHFSFLLQYSLSYPFLCSMFFQGSLWLYKTIDENNESMMDTSLDLPLKSNGDNFQLSELMDDQREVAVYILQAIQKYYNQDPTFKPIRMTLMGKAGSGKTFFVKTMISAVRQMFGYRRAALVSAPTGAAAFVSGGVTIQRLCGMTPHNCKDALLSDALKERLIKEFFDTILLFIDERSMTELETLGKAKSSIAQSTRGGQFSHKSWGDLPVVVLIGDDMQLPAVRKGTWYLPVGPEDDRYKGKLKPLEQMGRDAFLEAAKDVMVLGTVKRQDDSEKQFKEILEQIRNDCLTETNFQHLKKFHLQGDTWSLHKVRHLEQDAMFLYSKKESVATKNMQMLEKTSSSANPVAKIFCDYPRSKHESGKGVNKHFDHDLPTLCLICVGAKVTLCNKNFNPRWGLFNGARGTVIKISFAKGKTPNNGDLPEYVIVDFPHYTGPAYFSNQPTVSVLCFNLFVSN